MDETRPLSSREARTSRIMLGCRIATARRRAGITQDELAARAGIQRSWVSMIENGRKRASPRTVVALCEALRLDAMKATDPCAVLPGDLRVIHVLSRSTVAE